MSRKSIVREYAIVHKTKVPGEVGSSETDGKNTHLHSERCPLRRFHYNGTPASKGRGDLPGPVKLIKFSTQDASRFFFARRYVPHLDRIVPWDAMQQQESSQTTKKHEKTCKGKDWEG